jgi:hypothetical protein
MINNLIFKAHLKMINKNKEKIIKLIKIWNISLFNTYLKMSQKRTKACIFLLEIENLERSEEQI